MAPSNVSRARRVLVAQTDSSKNVAPFPSAKGNDGGKGFPEALRSSAASGRVSAAKEMIEQRKSTVDAEAMPAPDDSSLTPPSITETMNTSRNENIDSTGLRIEECRPGGSSPNSGLDRSNDGLLKTYMNGGLDCKNAQAISLSRSVLQCDSRDGAKVQFSHAVDVNSACPDEPSKSK